MSNTSVNEYKDLCPIWGTPAVLEIPSGGRDAIIVHSSPRAGGGYEISGTAASMVKFIDDHQKARLTTKLIDFKLQSNLKPFISSDTIQEHKIHRPENNLSVIDRANRLLKFFVKKSEKYFIGHILNIDSDCQMHSLIEHNHPRHSSSKSYQDAIDIYYEGLAYSESLTWKEVKFLINYLSKRNFIEISNQSNDYKGLEFSISVEGYRYIEQNITNPDSSQVFVAMWFGEEMNEIYEHGIAPAIKHTGYKPMRIDRKLDVNKIDDEIIAEIRRSRFLTADFTHGYDGARGGVYYEAGFAHGLNIPVIFSCRKDIVDKLHFDTRQYHHIVWKTSAELRDNLTKRILALIGQGPLQPPTP